MKKWLLLLAAAVVVAGVWYYLRTYVRYRPEWDRAKFGKVTRGEISVPITAAGLIEPRERVNIKSEASGQVRTIAVVEGDYVRKGDVLVVLKQDDEERRLAQAQAALVRARAALAKAEVAVEQATQNIITAEARVDEIRGNGELVAFELKRAEELAQRDYTAEKELIAARANAQINAAQLRLAEANVLIARSALEDARQNVVIQQAAVEEATKAVEDAEERLAETTILAPQDGIVTEVFVAEGDLVQSATQSFTGGTPVMMLADVSKLKVIARVDEADIGRVLKIAPVEALPELPGLKEAALENARLLEQRSGRVRLTVDAFPDQSFEGRIIRAEPQGRLNTGSAIIQFDVHVEVTDERRYLLPLGTQAQVEFTIESVADALLVPADAVMTFEDERGVWVKTPPAGPGEEFGKKFVCCRFGITDGAHTQVVAVEGGATLHEGQEVFTKLPRERGED